MGFCGYAETSYMTPPLSTIDLDFETIGRTAADLMLRASEWYQQDTAPHIIHTPHHILERESISTIETSLTP